MYDYYINYFKIETDQQDYYRCVDYPSEQTDVNCWHVPFELRYKAEKNRFNQLGVPCFYLASSESVASKETGKIDSGKRRWCVKFRQIKPLYYLDFSIPCIEKMTEYEHFSFLITYPIRLMCLTKVKEKSCFCEEYLFSQLLFHLLFLHKNDKWPKIDGIKYMSMHDKFSTCIVIPALYKSKTPQESGYSEYIQNCFKELEKPHILVDE